MILKHLIAFALLFWLALPVKAQQAFAYCDGMVRLPDDTISRVDLFCYQAYGYDTPPEQEGVLHVLSAYGHLDCDRLITMRVFWTQAYLEFTGRWYADKQETVREVFARVLLDRWNRGAVMLFVGDIDDGVGIWGLNQFLVAGSLQFARSDWWDGD